MAIFPTRPPQWWDREVDHRGRVLRPDVRAAVQEVWKAACALARTELIDIHDATEIMEKSVAQISNNLNERASVPSKGDNIPALLMENFRKELRKHKKRLQRFELMENPDEIAEYRKQAIWEDGVHSRLDFNAFFEPLTDREQAIFQMRDAAGYDWESVGRACGISASRAMHIYRDAIRRMQARYERGSCGRKPPKS